MEKWEHIDLGDGVTMTRSTQEDYDWINAHLRADDAAEQRVFGEGFKDTVAMMERSWTIRDGENIVGFIATVIMQGDSPLSTRRMMAQMTTEYVWKIKVKYVRYSRRVLRAVVENTAAWVNDFYTMPMASYVGAVKWDERILGLHRMGVVQVNGVDHVLFRIGRKEVCQ